MWHDGMTGWSMGFGGTKTLLWIVLTLIIVILAKYLFSKPSESQGVTGFDNYEAWEKSVHNKGATKIYRDTHAGFIFHHNRLYATNEDDDLLYGQWNEKSTKGQVYNFPYHFRQFGDNIDLVKKL